ncbi:hypothetical protein B0A53_00482 [Rhodotorula sp. CCFEE 5036]|nr:hypothetical protein B0A53_00482 [Rhodotorula sp. CCFEE 5036]
MSAVLSALPELPKLVEPAQTINGKRIRVPPRVNLSPVTVNNLGTVRKLHNVLFPVNYDSHFYSSLTDDRLHHPEDYCKLIYYQDLPVGVLVCRLEENDHEAPKTLSEAVASVASSSAEEANGKEQSSSEDTAKEGGKKASDSKKPQIDDQKTYKLYVMTLGVLAPYRQQGLGSKLIHHVLSTAAESLAQPPAAPTPSSTPTPKTNGTSPAAPPTKGGKAASSSAKPESITKKDEKDEEEKERKEPPKPRVESVYLHVQVGNDEAKRFWEKWGFEVKETVTDYYRKISPRDAWLLERKVAPAATSS